MSTRDPIMEYRYYALRSNPLTIARPWSVEYRTVHLDIVHRMDLDDAPDDTMPKGVFRREFVVITPEPPMDGSRYYTLDLCECCYVALVNGDGCSCGEDTEQHPEGLMGKLSGEEVTSGLLAQEHDDACPVKIYGTGGINFPADSFKCDCERTDFSHSGCDGCGTSLYGSREKATGWIKQS